jgi:hypothetical protein
MQRTFSWDTKNVQLETTERNGAAALDGLRKAKVYVSRPFCTLSSKLGNTRFFSPYNLFLAPHKWNIWRRIGRVRLPYSHASSSKTWYFTSYSKWNFPQHEQSYYFYGIVLRQIRTAQMYHTGQFRVRRVFQLKFLWIETSQATGILFMRTVRRSNGGLNVIMFNLGDRRNVMFTVKVLNTCMETMDRDIKLSHDGASNARCSAWCVYLVPLNENLPCYMLAAKRSKNLSGSRPG